MKPYSLSATNEVCPEAFNYLSNIHDCEDAVPWIRSKYAPIDRDVFEKNSNDYPSGCYVVVSGSSKGIYFNADSTNSPARLSSQVCIKGTLADAFYKK